MQAVRRGLIHTYVPAAIVVVLLAAPSAAADTFKVNTGADLAPNGCTKGDCSVREAIIAANKHKGKDTVVLRSGRLHGLAIHGDDEDESKTGDLDVLGKTTHIGIVELAYNTLAYRLGYDRK
jgi:CSLREA domain-containing protein